MSKTQGSLGVISGQFCMINHALEKDRREKKNPIYFLCIENSCWKRSKGTDKEMRESTSSRLHLAPYERKKITLKPLPWWKKKVLWLMYSSRGGINSMNDSKIGLVQIQIGGWGVKKRTVVWENFFFEELECYLTAVNKTAIPLSGTQCWIISGVCIQKDSRCHQIVRSFAVPTLGVLLGWAPVKCLSQNTIGCHILPQPPRHAQNRSWKENSLQTFH